jgi:hypothetical protein
MRKRGRDHKGAGTGMLNDRSLPVTALRGILDSRAVGSEMHPLPSGRG